MGSVALVLSLLFPSIGNWWYGLTALSPAAYLYYMGRGTREEEVGGGLCCLFWQFAAAICSSVQLRYVHCAMIWSNHAAEPVSPVMFLMSLLAAIICSCQHSAVSLWCILCLYGTSCVQVRVKMATADDEQTTDITVEGDIEEINRFCKVCNSCCMLNNAVTRDLTAHTCMVHLCVPVCRHAGRYADWRVAV